TAFLGLVARVLLALDLALLLHGCVGTAGGLVRIAHRHALVLCLLESAIRTRGGKACSRFCSRWSSAAKGWAHDLQKQLSSRPSAPAGYPPSARHRLFANDRRRRSAPAPTISPPHVAA